MLGVFDNGDAQIGQKYIQQNTLKKLPQPAAPADPSHLFRFPQDLPQDQNVAHGA